MSAELLILQRALALSREGRRQDARRLYGEVLCRDPHNADALHLLGLLYLECGQTQAAAGLISRAIQQRPEDPFFYNTLGNAFRGLDKRDQALLCFRKSISLQPDFAEALSNLGSALEEAGRAVEAIPFHQKAAVLQPERAEVHGNLANALRSAGRPEEAMAAYANALRLRPDFAEAWMNLGNLYFDREEFDRAAEHYGKALRLSPRLAAAQTNLGSALAQLGQFEQAEVWCRQALELSPDDARALCNLASVLVMTARPEAAESYCRRSLQIQPGLAEAHSNLGRALARMHLFSEAEEHCREALRLRPGDPGLHSHLASVLLLSGRFGEAEAALRRALELRPGHLPSWSCWGDLCAAQRDYAGALRWYDRVVERAPNAWQTRPARAMVCLTIGDFERGWQEYEWRWKRGDCAAARFDAPAWDGSPFPGKTILVHAEQGLGDTLQFVRYLPFVKRLGGRVVFACQELLMPLQASMEGADEVIAKSGVLPRFDCHLPLLSLPRVLGTREHSIPGGVPYLKAPPEAIAEARKRLVTLCGERDGRLRVGLVWSGSAQHANDRNRSMSLDQTGPLMGISGVQFVSLQQGTALPAGCPAIRAIGDADDLAIAAAIVMQMDLVITVDTMMAHLAGSLGRPVWTLLPFSADWRWMTDRDDSPWYPTMRLFRQSHFGGWDEVIERVCAELSRLRAPDEMQRPGTGHPGKTPGILT